MLAGRARRRRRGGQRPRRARSRSSARPPTSSRCAPRCRTAGIEYESADQSFLPSVQVPLDEDGARKVLKLVDALEDLDDVQNVYANFDVSDDDPRGRRRRVAADACAPRSRWRPTKASCGRRLAAPVASSRARRARCRRPASGVISDRRSRVTGREAVARRRSRSAARCRASRAQRPKIGVRVEVGGVVERPGRASGQPCVPDRRALGDGRRRPAGAAAPMPGTARRSRPSTSRAAPMPAHVQAVVGEQRQEFLGSPCPPGRRFGAGASSRGRRRRRWRTRTAQRRGATTSASTESRCRSVEGRAVVRRRARAARRAPATAARRVPGRPHDRPTRSPVRADEAEPERRRW